WLATRYGQMSAIETGGTGSADVVGSGSGSGACGGSTASSGVVIAEEDTRRPRIGPTTSAARTSPETQKSWRRPIFPKGCPLSIFGAGELDFRVRDGNGYGLSASVTRISCVWTSFGSGPRAVTRTGGAPI